MALHNMPSSLEFSSSTTTTTTLLPPGFRFHPTDEELILHYLRLKTLSLPLPVPIIKDLDLYKFDPWELPAKAESGEKEWYFFSPRERKYPNGDRPNRAACSGFWKATGSDKPIACSSTGIQIGVKKALVFYRGKPPKGEKTDWIMHEYRMLHYDRPPPRLSARKSLQLDDWVLCRIYKKRATTYTSASLQSQCKAEQFQVPISYHDDILPSLSSTIPKQDSDLLSNTSCGSYDINTFFDTISHGQLEPSTNQPNRHIQDYHSHNLNQQHNQDPSSRPQITNFQPMIMSSSKLNEVLMYKLLNISRTRAHDHIMQETLFNLPNLTQMSPTRQFNIDPNKL